jgi:chromosomal replication initiation ATPase DnaA
VHILADSSKRDVERHAIQVTFWDDEKDQPVTVPVALAVIADASSTALAKLTLSALLTAGVTFEQVSPSSIRSKARSREASPPTAQVRLSRSSANCSPWPAILPASCGTIFSDLV